MTKIVNIHEFDVEEYQTWAVEDDESGKILGFIFRKPDIGISKLVTMKNSEDVMEIDLAICAERIMETYHGYEKPVGTESH